MPTFFGGGFEVFAEVFGEEGAGYLGGWEEGGKDFLVNFSTKKMRKISIDLTKFKKTTLNLKSVSAYYQGSAAARNCPNYFPI